jgi:Protein of unknown function (DUF2842)
MEGAAGHRICSPAAICCALSIRHSLLAIRHAPIMSIRIRKLIGTVALFVLVTVWALLAMALAQSALTDTNFWIAALYYAVAGLGWVLPAMPLIRWMLRPDGRRADEPKA